MEVGDCQSAVIDAATGREVQRCGNVATWRVMRKFSGLVQDLCDVHRVKTPSGAYKAEMLPLTPQQRARMGNRATR